MILVEMNEIIALDQRVAKLSVANTGPSFTKARLHKVTAEHLANRHVFTHHAQKVEIVKILKPVVIID
ncbi:hypothetical protein D3C87_1601680 [compost metagenome]